MSAKHVLVHSCNPVDDFDDRPKVCRCKRHVTEKRAQLMCGHGEAKWRKKSNGTGDYNEIVLCGRRPTNAITIGARQIELAFAEGREYDRERIEIYPGIA